MVSEKAATEPMPATEGAVVMATDSEPDEKRIPDVTDRSTEESDGPRDFPLAWKLTALICGIALSWGSSFSENTLGPLKSTLIKQLDITNSQVRIRDTDGFSHRCETGTDVF